MRRFINRMAVTAGGLRAWSVRLVLIGAAAVSLLTSQRADGQAVAPSPAPPLARYIPGDELAFYWEFEGLSAHAEGARKSAISKLLNDTPLGALLEDLATQVITKAQQQAPPGRQVPAADYLALLRHGVQEGLAVGVFGKGPDKTNALVVVRKGNRPEFLRFMRLIATSGGFGPDLKQDDRQVSGRTLHPLGANGVWWLEQDDLLMTGKIGVETVLAVIEGKAPSAVNHPLRAQVMKAEQGLELASYAFLDFAALPALPPEAKREGFDGIKHIELQWGFQGDALMTVVRCIAPAPRRGVLALFDQPTFNLQSLPAIPAGQHAFAVLSIDLAKTYEQFATLVRPTDANTQSPVDAVDNAFRQQFGLNLREDVLRPLGPKVAIYAQPTAAPPPGNPLAAMVTPYTGMTISIQVRDHAAFSGTVRSTGQDDQPGAGDAARRRGRPAPVPQEERAAQRVRAGVPAGLGSRGSGRASVSHHRAGQGATDHQRHVGRRREGPDSRPAHRPIAAGRPPARSCPWPSACPGTW